MTFQSMFISVASISTGHNSSWIYLVDWILALILALAFIFYFNRLIGFIFSYLLQFILWKKYRVKVNVESMMFAPLGGRIFVKNLTIITVNQTISILELTFTWRYWLFKLTRLSEYYFGNEPIEPNGTTKQDNEKLPSRFVLWIDGLEIFMYNRTMAYDSIMEILKQEEQRNQGRGEQHSSTSDNTSDNMSASNNIPSIRYRRPNAPFNDKNTDINNTSIPLKSKLTENDVASESSQTEFSVRFILQLLPLSVRIKKGAIVVGNASTPSIMVASYKAANGMIDICEAPNMLDNYRYVGNFKFDAFQLSMKPNITYDIYNYTQGALNESRKSKSSKVNNKGRYRHWFNFHQAVNNITNLITKKKSYLEAESNLPQQWKGLRRYINESVEEQNILGIMNTDEEYAKYSLILDSLSTSITYYYDSPGFISLEPVSVSQRNLPPEFGVDIELSMATIHYGPWADKQRVPLQSMFFPSLSRDSKPTRISNVPGSLRQYNGFKVSVSVRDEVIFRIPTREPSKDKEIIKTHATTHLSNNKVSRPFGWLELKMNEGSNISSFTSFVATEEGWPNRLKAFFNKPELRSSVNHDVLLTAHSHNLDCKIGFPLQWNGKCQWKFDSIIQNTKIFFLREHIMLLSDIFTDFASGTPTPYESLRPFEYIFNWKVNGYELYLNVNDSNIISNPLDFSSNKYLSLQGDDLNCHLFIPSNNQLTKSTTIDYKIYTSFFNLVLDTPPWHTINAFMKDSKIMGRSNHFTVEGSYTYFSTVEVNTSNFVVIKCLGDFITMKLYGFLVKYLFIIRENYFGDHVHFKTFEEYTSGLAASSNRDSGPSDNLTEDSDSTKTEGPEIDYWKIIRTDNDIDVLFMFQVRHGLILLPFNIYDSSSHIGLSFDSLDVDIRFTDYYMDLQADFSPVSAIFLNDTQNEMNTIFNIPNYVESFLNTINSDLCIDGFTIHAHRMFGIPPETHTYFCKWDFACGDITIDSNGSFLAALKTSIRNFVFSFKDLENGLNTNVPTIYDAANFSFRCPRIQIKLKSDVEDASNPYFLFDFDSILVTFNDIANNRYSSKMTVMVSSIILKIIDETENCEKVIGYLKTSLIMNNICQKEKMVEHRRLQQEHIRVNDAPFHRSPFLLFEEERDVIYNDAYGCFLTSLTLPDVCYPLNKDSAALFNRECHNDSSEFCSTDETDVSSTSSKDYENYSADSTLPLADYNPEEFCPSYEVNSKYKYDNLIFEVGEIQSFLTPSSLLPVSELLQSTKSYSLTDIMDDLQVKLVSQLYRLISPTCIVDNIRFVTQEISFKFSNFDVDDPSEVFIKPPKIPIINLSLFEPSLAFSHTIDREKTDNSTRRETKISAAFHLGELFFSISNPSEFKLPVYSSFKDVEFWFTKEDLEGYVGSSNMESVDIAFHEPQTIWLVNYIKSIQEQIQPAITEFQRISNAVEKCISELVYKITKSGAEYHIDHDPAVLTKPAYMLRANKDHIRFYDSWKVMTRLRHVLDNLPPSWHQEQNKLFNEFKWEVPETAYREVTEIFSRWRSWEANEAQRRYFFNATLLNDQDINLESSENAKFQFRISNFAIKLSTSKKKIDLIRLQDVSTSASVKLEKYKDLTAMNFGILETLTHVDIIFNLSLYKSNISTLSLGLFPVLCDELSKDINNEDAIPIAKTRKATQNDSKNFSISFVSNINSFQQNMSLPFSHSEFNGTNICNTGTAFIFGSADGISFDFLNKAELYDIGLWGANSKILSNTFEEFNILLSNVGGLEHGTKLIDSFIRKCSFSILDENETFCDTLMSIIEKDITYLKKLTQLGSNKSSQVIQKVTKDNEKHISLLDKFSSVMISLQVRELSYVVEIFSPLNLSFIVYDNNFSFRTSAGDSFIESFVQKLDFNARYNLTSIIEFQNSQIVTDIKLSQLNDMILASASTSLGYTKLFISQIINTLNIVIANKNKVTRKIELLKQALDLMEITNKDAKTSVGTHNLLDKIVFKFNFSNDYIGLSTFLEKTRFSFEVEGTTFGIYNVANSIKDEISIAPAIVPWHGEFSVTTARFSVIDRSISVGLSNILDVSVSVRILNDNEIERRSRSLQVESQHFRVCLSPQVLFKLVGLTESLTALINKNGILNKEIASAKRKEKYKDKFSIFNFSAIQVLSYNFCIGWLFGESQKEYPGIILGADRFFAITEEGLGKFTLMEAYLSVANGTRSSNFYSVSSEKNNLNRAFLPTMQLVYTVEQIEDSKSMRMFIYGDELDVKFLSNSIAIVEHTVSSGSKVQEFFNRRIRPPSPTKLKKDNDRQNEYISSIKSTFSSIEFIATFAGSNVLFYRLNDETSDTPPSLFLHSPAVKIATMYKHQKSGGKKHIIKSEILTSSSDNTLYSSCVPVIIDIVEGLKKMMRKSNYDSATAVKVTSNNTTKDFNFGNLLNEMDVHIGLRIEKQKLSLSCEPTAKVAVIAEIDGIYIQINTVEKEVATLVSAVQFDHISASLQHIYSREVSGSISTKSILLTSSVEFGEVANILSAGSFSDVDAYINVKQYQDLDLFKDIWIPEQYSYLEFDSNDTEMIQSSDISALAHNKNVSSRFKEVSTTYALPWVLNFMIFNVSLRMDFGQSLGNFMLTLDKFWAVSKKSSDWAHDLKLGIDSISLVSEGRLGGYFELQNINLHTAISWKVDSETILDVPLILVSGGIDKLHLKTSFDYHVFAIANIEGYSINIFNQKSKLTISKDHLFITTKFDRAEMYVTSLAASTFLDIYNTISRMIQENKKSYKETLRDSLRGKIIGERKSNTGQTPSNEILETVKKLETEIEVIVGSLLIQIYPSSFDDSKLLVIRLDESKANFQQNEYISGISNELEIQFNDLNVSLSMVPIISKDFISQCTVDEFIDYAHKARGGNIFVFPSFKISMRTFQKYNANLIEYFYQSSFGGTVGIRWNLGSINFIREMYSVHKRALASRIEYRKKSANIVFKENIFSDQSDEPSNILRQQLNEEDPTEKIDQAIGETIDKVSNESKYTYSALAPPIIEAPQIKELGNATPPLEWFGLHRDKFPNVTHQVAIVSLQKLIHEFEVQYSKRLGKAKHHSDS